MLVLGLVDIPWWVILIIVIIAYLSYTTCEFNYFKKQGIPSYRPWPIFGSSLYLLRKGMIVTELEMMELSREKGCFGNFLGTIPTFTVHDGKMLAEIMVKEFSSFTNRQVFPSGSLSDNMLLNLCDQHWKHVRTEMTPTFTTGKLKKFNVEINRCGKTLADSLTEPAKLGQVIEMKEYAGGYTMDVISSTAFGIRVDSQKDRNNDFIIHARKAFDIQFGNPLVILRFLSPTLNSLLIKLGFPFNLIPKDTQEFFYDVTRQAMKMRKADANQSRADFLQLMIKAQKGENIKDDDDQDTDVSGKSLTTDEILANAMLFFTAGYDTTSSSLSFFMLNMGKYPECQAKLVDEIDRVIQDKDFVDHSLLQEMPYLDQCVNENLRLYPPAMVVNREAARDITINGIFIRKGAIVNIPIFGIHRDPTKWPAPEKFDPERFSPENKKDRNPYHFVPFGNGPRICIGMRLALQELKVAIIHVLKKVKFSTCEKTQFPVEFVKLGGLLKAKDGIWLKVETRN